MESVNVLRGLTTQAQRPGARDATIANYDAMPGSLQRMVSRIKSHSESFLNSSSKTKKR
jgi:hypothetical protein